jgi:hypothetical protein
MRGMRDSRSPLSPVPAVYRTFPARCRSCQHPARGLSRRDGVLGRKRRVLPGLWNERVVVDAGRRVRNAS